MKKWVVCENLRSAYNVWNIIRTADGLGWWVILVWYTAPKEHKKVIKTALWAEETVELLKFDNLEDFYNWIKNNQICMISAEKTDTSVSLCESWLLALEWSTWSVYEWVALVMGNEVSGVEWETLDKSDYIFHIPMVGKKESFNVGQAAAILMWDISRLVS